MTSSMSPRSMSVPGAPVDASSTSHVDERVGDLVERRSHDRRRGARAAGRGARLRLATMISLDARAARARAPCPRRRRRRRAAARAGRRASRAARPRHATAADEIDTAWRPMPVSVRARLPTSTAWRNVRDSSWPRGAFALGGLPRLADLPEDLALADDHRVEPRGDAEEVRDRGVVVVRVELVGEGVGVDARAVGEEVPHVARCRRGTGSCGRRPRCGCTWRGARPRRGARAPRGRGAPWAAPRAAPSCARAGRPRRCGGSVRRRRETRLEELLGLGRAAGADEIEHAGIEGTPPIDSPRSNARARGALPGPRRAGRAASAHSGPSSVGHVVLEVGGERRAAPSGADGDHEVALAHHRHQRERAVRGVVGRVAPRCGEPRRPPRRHGWCRGRRWRWSRARRRRDPWARTARSATVRRPRVARTPRSRRRASDRDDVHHRAGVEQRLDLARRDPPAADDDAPPPVDEEVDRVPAEATRGGFTGHLASTIGSRCGRRLLGSGHVHSSIAEPPSQLPFRNGSI